MADNSDAWFVRLPDGQVVRGNSTAAVRHHLETGRLPIDAHVRRSPEDGWLTLDRTEEFADFAPPRPAREHKRDRDDLGETPSRTNPLRLETLGVRGFAEDLISALDSALTPAKLRVAAWGCAAAGLTIGLRGVVPVPREMLWESLATVLIGLVAFGVLSVAVVVLTQMTFVELSRLRPATESEARANLATYTTRLVLTQGLVILVLLLAMVGMRFMPIRLHQVLVDHVPAAEWFAGVAAALALILEVLAWLAVGLTTLFPAIAVVEDLGFVATLRLWFSLVKQHCWRLLFQQGTALLVGGCLAMPLLFAFWLASRPVASPVVDPTLHHVAASVLSSLALFPLVAYLTVANVYIYLHLRYEQRR